MKRLLSAPVLIGLLALLAAVGIAGFVLTYQMQVSSSSGSSSGSAIVKTSVKIGGAFNLVDQNGTPVTENSYPDKYKIYYFGYSFCPDVCPTDLYIIGQAMAELEDKAPEVAGMIQPIFITVDPARDKPEIMGEYVANFHERMVGLSGDDAQTASVAKAFRVYYKLNEPDEDGDYLVDHTAFTYLMGPDGSYRTMFRHDADPVKMAEDIQKIMKSDGL